MDYLLMEKEDTGFFQIKNIVIDTEDLNIYEKMIYIVLLRYANNSANNSCFPSVGTIRRKAGCSSRKASSVLSELAKKGLIIKQERKAEGTNRNMSNLYILRYMRENKTDLKLKEQKTEKKYKTKKNGFKNFEETYTKYSETELNELIKNLQGD